MAKKRSATALRSGASDDSKSMEATNSAMELAFTVSSLVEIEDVLLAEGRQYRSPDADTSIEGLKFEIAITSMKIGISDESGKLSIGPKFRLRSHFKGQTASDKSDVIIECRFVLKYDCSAFTELTQEQMKAFAFVNGVFNAWPYLREFVQNTSARMGLHPITLPVYRMGKPPFILDIAAE